MGIFMSCCGQSASDVTTPDAETRRRQQIEAAEKRRAEEAARGLKDPEKARRMQQTADILLRLEHEQMKDDGASLKWTTD